MTTVIPVCASSSKFLENFTNILVKIIKNNSNVSIIDYGSGSHRNFSKYFEGKYPQAKVINVDFSKECISPSIFMTENNEVKKYFNTIDLVHSSLVFHEVCDDINYADKKGGPLTKESKIIFSHLYKCLKSGGFIVIEDFVPCSFEDFVKYDPMIQTLREDGILKRNLEVVSKIKTYLIDKYPKITLKDISFACGYENGELFLFVKRLYFDKLQESTYNTENMQELNKLFLYFTKYIDHHMRNSITDCESALTNAGFIKVKSVSDFHGLRYQWIYRKV